MTESSEQNKPNNPFIMQESSPQLAWLFNLDAVVTREFYLHSASSLSCSGAQRSRRKSLEATTKLFRLPLHKFRILPGTTPSLQHLSTGSSLQAPQQG